MDFINSAETITDDRNVELEVPVVGDGASIDGHHVEAFPSYSFHFSCITSSSMCYIFP